MRHLDDGTLRLLVDGITPAGAREHLVTCPRCRTRLDAARADAQSAALWLEAPQSPVDGTLALGSIRTRTAPHMTPVRRTVAPEIRTAWWRRPAAGIAAAAVLVSGLVLTPAGSWAQSLVTIFQPQSVAAVPISSAGLQGLPDLSQFGTMHVSSGRARTVSSAAEASAAAGLHVLVPGFLPSGTPDTPRYGVTAAATASFTFSAARAQAEAQKEGKVLPPMPTGMDGSTLTVTVPPGVVTLYRAGKGGIPTLAVGEIGAPGVTSTGVTVRQLEDYLVALDPALKPAVAGMGDPTHTLPIPVPLDRATSQSVQVQGTRGVAMGDATGLGSAVVWEKDGVIYAVGGTTTLDAVLHVANSLR